MYRKNKYVYDDTAYLVCAIDACISSCKASKKYMELSPATLSKVMQTFSWNLNFIYFRCVKNWFKLDFHFCSIVKIKWKYFSENKLLSVYDAADEKYPEQSSLLGLKIQLAARKLEVEQFGRAEKNWIIDWKLLQIEYA